MSHDPIRGTDYRAEVARGIALLDEVAPGWRERVDVDRLRTESCTRCALGQVFGHYYTGIDRLAAAVTVGGTGLVAYAYGFDIRPGYTPHRAEYDLLDRAWKEALA